MSRKIRHVTALGGKALEILATGREARIMGATSRGLFLQTGGPDIDPWLCFVSWEPWRGPLTLNVPERVDGLGPGDPARLGPGRLVLPGVDLEWSADRLWEPGPPPPSDSDPGVRRARARTLLVEAERRDRRSALAHLLHGSGPLEATALLGLGPGLTPSGDDVLLGALLVRARRTAPGVPTGEGAAEGPAGARVADLLREARRRTTTLSANLLAMAHQGLADERLVNLADHVNAGTACDAAFLDWGAHSGVDVLLGMALEERLLAR